MKSALFKSISLLLLITVSNQALAQDKKSPAAKPNPEEEAERVNVEAIKEKYWARGEESELGVVQNRLYSKAKRWEVGAFGGLVFSDPFLSIKNYGGSLGYHFTEYFAFRGMYWQTSVSPSSAKQAFNQAVQGETNSNPPESYFGGEAQWSFLYGKLSLVGKSIVYYDMYLLGGMGMTNTENGNYFTPHIGLGQQVYLSKYAALRLDYRYMTYKEEIIEKVVPSRRGQSNGFHWNSTNVITLGISFFLGGGSTGSKATGGAQK